MKKLSLALLSGAVCLMTGCSKDDWVDFPIGETAHFTVTIENIAPVKAFVKSGVFNTPVGDANPGAATPGKMYEFTIDAGRRHHLAFVTMLAATNDLFFGPDAEGIALYDEDGEPLSGDVTDQVYLWDAGTEVNEEPAVGPNTVTKQPAPNTGEAENGNVMLIQDVTNGVAFDYPAVSDIIKVTVTHIAGTQFKVTIQDLATAMLQTSEGDKPAPVSPGVWVVYGGQNPLYTPGMPDFGHGVEAIAEDGNAAPLGAYVAANTGVTYPASPGVWVVHHPGTKPLFTAGMPDYGDGLEAIAEDGNASILGANISSLEGEEDGAVFNMPVGSSSPGPILPGLKYRFSFKASAGDRLSFATMLAATNDVFIGTDDKGISLFDHHDKPIRGDITSKVYLWDVGTEVNEEPAIGPNTVTNQLGPDTGIDETQPVQRLSEVGDGFAYPAVEDVLKVTITKH